MTRHCCKVGCTDAAAFEIICLTGDYEDTTDSCLAHVGDLLGSITDAPWGSYAMQIRPLVPASAGRPTVPNLSVVGI